MLAENTLLKPLVISFCSLLGSTLLLIERTMIDPLHLWVITNKVCKLQRSIYGLVQASQSWNIRFDEVIKAYGFIQTFGEACIYKKVSGSSVAFLILYVDDILLIGNDIEFLDSIKGYLNKNFQ